MSMMQRLYLFVGGLAIVVSPGCTADREAQKQVISAAINEVVGEAAFPTGKALRLSSELLAYMRKAEAAGLVTLREVPQGYWDSFLNSTQSMAAPFDVTETPKLEAVARNPNLGGEAGDNDRVYTLRVKASSATVEEIITDEPYTGSLASPGEEYRLVLGTFRNDPTAAAVVLGPDLMSQVPWVMRFRCVLHYNEFNEAWNVVALDMGALDSEQWNSDNVR